MLDYRPGEGGEAVAGCQDGLARCRRGPGGNVSGVATQRRDAQRRLHPGPTPRECRRHSEPAVRQRAALPRQHVTRQPPHHPHPLHLLRRGGESHDSHRTTRFLFTCSDVEVSQPPHHPLPLHLLRHGGESHDSHRTTLFLFTCSDVEVSHMTATAPPASSSPAPTWR